MTKGKIKFYKYDNDDLITCDCSACDNIRHSYGKIPKRELSCRERLVNFLRKIIFR
jgi:hypothetical protein